MDIDTLGWVIYSLTLKRVPAGVLFGLLTADILSTLNLLDARSAIVPTQEGKTAERTEKARCP